MSPRFSERLLWMTAMFLIAFGFFILLPMGNDYPAVMPEGTLYNYFSISDHYCAGIAEPVVNTSYGGNTSDVSINKPVELSGCPYHTQYWCTRVPKIYLFQYAIALLFIAVGYPTSSVMCYSIYSKILGPSKQVMPSSTRALAIQMTLFLML